MSFIYELANHVRLTWRLFWDDDIRWWHRAVFFVPLIYLLIPFRYDVLVDLAPIVGLLDDWLLALLCSYVFTFLCPRRVVRRHRDAIALSDPDPDVRERARRDVARLESLTPIQRLEMYRHPRESLACVLGMGLLVALSTVGGVLAGAFLVLALGASYVVASLGHARALRGAVRADPEAYPEVHACLWRCYEHLPYVPVNVVVIDSDRPNAYSFGIEHPYTVVLSSGLLETFRSDELVVVIGHEMGHVLFEHTFLSSLMGGMLHRLGSGGRGLAGLLWSLLFLRWRRLAERTADRISLLACEPTSDLGPRVGSGRLASPMVRRSLDVCIRTMVKLAVGSGAEIEAEVDDVLERAYGGKRHSDGASDLFGRLGGLVGTHPELVARVRALVDFDAELLALDVERWLAAGA